MGLLDLVQEHHAERPPPHALGELAAFLVADIAGRGADQPGDGVALHVFAHIQPDHGVLGAEHVFGERLGELGLADPGGPQEQEVGDRPAAFAQARPRQAHGVGDGPHSLVLADDALVELLLHLGQPLAFLDGELRDRDAGQLGHDLGDLLDADLRGAGADAATPALRGLLQPLALLLPARLEVLDPILALAGLGAVELALQLAHLRLQLQHLGRPGRGVDLHPRRSLVDQVDGLVGQETVGDVAL